MALQSTLYFNVAQGRLYSTGFIVPQSCLEHHQPGRWYRCGFV